MPRGLHGSADGVAVCGLDAKVLDAVGEGANTVTFVEKHNGLSHHQSFRKKIEKKCAGALQFLDVARQLIKAHYKIVHLSADFPLEQTSIDHGAS